MKKCNQCSEIKEFVEFYKDSTTIDLLTRSCKKCHKDYRDLNKEKNKAYQTKRRQIDNEKVKAIKRKSWQNLDPRKRMLQQAKNRANRKGMDFNLELEDIKIPKVCPLLNIPFIVGTKDNYEYTHSLDRLDSTKGYVKGNVWVITKLANSMKNSATKEQLILFATNILKNFKEDDIVQTLEKSKELKDKEL